MKKSLIVIAAFLSLAGSLAADNLTWGGTWLSEWSGFGTSPYTAYDSTLKQNITILCLDFNDEIAPPNAWQASIYGLTQSAVTQNAQFGGHYGESIGSPFPNLTPFGFTQDPGVVAGHSVDLSASATAYTRYLEAAWLFDNLLDAKAAGDVKTAVISQVAAWDLFVEQGTNLTTLTTDIQYYNTHSWNGYVGQSYTFKNYLGNSVLSSLYFEDAVNEALKAAQKAVVDQQWIPTTTWSLVTGDPVWARDYNHGLPVQEFLTPSVIPNPEPGAIVLLGTVLLILGRTQRRRFAARFGASKQGD